MASTFITKRYGNKYLFPTYLTSSYVAYSRVASKKHYISDVVVGGAVGIITSSLFTKSYNFNVNGNKHYLYIEPTLTQNSFGVFLTII